MRSIPVYGLLLGGVAGALGMTFLATSPWTKDSELTTDSITKAAQPDADNQTDRSDLVKPDVDADPGRSSGPDRGVDATPLSHADDDPTPSVDELLEERALLIVERDRLIGAAKHDAIGAVDRMVFLGRDEACPIEHEELVVITGSYNGQRYFIPEVRAARPELFAAMDRIRAIEADANVQHTLFLREALSATGRDRR